MRGSDQLGGGPNVFAYVYNNPLKWTDPSGLKVLRCCRPPDINPVANFAIAMMGAKHCFIKTDRNEGGMGPANDGPLLPFP